MKKIIINLMSIVLLCSVFCPVCAQQDNSAVGIDDEIAQRTKFKTISDNNFQFPSSLGSAEVFTEGKRLLDIMERKSTTAQPQPYLPPELSTEHGVNDYFLY